MNAESSVVSPEIVIPSSTIHKMASGDDNALVIGDIPSKKESTDTKKPKKSWKKPIDKPKRPLSAYNLFFQSERKRMLGPDAEKNKESSKDDKSKRRIHRKTHGKISFGDMAKVIGAKWKALDEDTRSMFDDKAEEDKARYFRELNTWKKEQQRELQQQMEQYHAEQTEKPSSSNASIISNNENENESEEDKETHEKTADVTERKEDSSVQRQPLGVNEQNALMSFLNRGYGNLQQQQALAQQQQALALQHAALFGPPFNRNPLIPPAASHDWRTTYLLNQYLAGAAARSAGEGLAYPEYHPYNAPYGRGIGTNSFAPANPPSINSTTPMDIINATNSLPSSKMTELGYGANAIGGKPASCSSTATEAAFSAEKQAAAASSMADFGKLHKLAMITEMLSANAAEPLSALPATDTRCE